MFYDTLIEGVKVVDVKLYGDARGGFMGPIVRKIVASGIDASFVQDNQSYLFRACSAVFTSIEHPKLVRVISGTVFDVAVGPARGKSNWGQ